MTEPGNPRTQDGADRWVQARTETGRATVDMGRTRRRWRRWPTTRKRATNRADPDEVSPDSVVWTRSRRLRFLPAESQPLPPSARLSSRRSPSSQLHPHHAYIIYAPCFLLQRSRTYVYWSGNDAPCFLSTSRRSSRCNPFGDSFRVQTVFQSLTESYCS